MKKSVSIIGGGPAALLLAVFLDGQKFKVTIFEKNSSLGKKFLLAGKGGFNLTHSEPIAQFIQRYTPPNFLQEALLGFDNQDLRDWFDDIGIRTYIGSSKRVYPKDGTKPIKVLSAILKVIDKQGVEIRYNHTWTGWNNTQDLIFNTDLELKSDYTIFALGGGSWKVTGSDGTWHELFKAQGIDVIPFQASNCAYKVNWKDDFILKHAGSPLKNIAIICLDKCKKGEVVITRFGIEGNAIYVLSPQIRDGLNRQQKAEIFLDLKPTLYW